MELTLNWKSFVKTPLIVLGNDLRYLLLFLPQKLLDLSNNFPQV